RGTEDGDIRAAGARPAAGRCACDVSAPRATTVDGAASWHPRWGTTIDGAPVAVEPTPGGTMRVHVPAGAHDVRVRYQPFPYAWLLAAIGIAALVLLRRLGRRDVGVGVVAGTTAGGDGLRRVGASPVA